MSYCFNSCQRFLKDVFCAEEYVYSNLIGMEIPEQYWSAFLTQYSGELISNLWPVRLLQSFELRTLKNPAEILLVGEIVT